MQLLKILPVILIVFISGCATQVNNVTSPEQPSQEQPSMQETTQQPTGAGTLQGEVTPHEQPPSLPIIKEFTIEADDRGFYTNNQDISSISADKGDVVKITFKVREAGTYYGGLDFRGCGQDTPDTNPGASIDIQFTADSTCTITSYWPSSGVVKDNLQIIVS